MISKTVHLSQQFETELQDVRTNLLAMGGLVEQQVTNALQSLITFDTELAHQAIEGDQKVNELEVLIDQECMNIIALRQPTAIDLRLISSIVKTINDLERIGDESIRIARMAINLSDKAASNRNYRGLYNLGNQVSHMLHDALDATARIDVDMALQVAKKDRDIDEEYEVLLRQLMTFMLEDPRAVSRMIDMMWVARSLERIGDHSRNICQHLIYLVEGKDVRHLSLEQTEKLIKSE